MVSPNVQNMQQNKNVVVIQWLNLLFTLKVIVFMYHKSLVYTDISVIVLLLLNKVIERNAG